MLFSSRAIFKEILHTARRAIDDYFGINDGKR